MSATETPADVAAAGVRRCAFRTRSYRGDELADEDFPTARISEHLDADDDAIVWVDLLDPELPDLESLAKEFGLHPLALEDAVEDHQRPKVDRYSTHLFLNVYDVHLEQSSGELASSEIAAFILPRALITVRKDDRFDVDTLTARCTAQGGWWSGCDDTV